MTWTSATTLTEQPRTRPWEMRFARNVQARLRPHRLPRLESLEYAGCCLPGRAVGGDFYDFLEPCPGRIAIVLGDISGKGVPAALMMAALQASLRSHYALSTSELERRIESVNRSFFECTALEHYATIFVGEYDDASGRLRYANCGHVPPLLVRADLGVERLESTATLLGMFENWTGSVGEVVLAPGDSLVLATDGILEATDSTGQVFGEPRLLSLVKNHRHLPPNSLIRTIAREVRGFSGDRTVDDQTLVVARVRAETARGLSRVGRDDDAGAW